MNKIYYLVIFIVFAYSAEAQLVEKENILVNNQKQKNSTLFTPKTIQFNASFPNSNDGLRAITKVGEQAILIEGNPITQRRTSNDILDVAKEYLLSAAPIMGIIDIDEEMVLVKAEVDNLQMHHIKYQQVYKSIPVYGSEIILHGKNDKIDKLMGRYEPTPDINTNPTLSIADAREQVSNHIGEIEISKNDIYEIFEIDPLKTELVIYKGQLAYHTTIYKNIVDRREIFIDAHSGSIIQEYKSFCKLHDHSFHDSKNKCSHPHSSDSKANLSHINAAPSGGEIANATDLLGITRTINTYEESGTYYMLDVSKTGNSVTPMFNNNSNLPDEPQGVIWTIDAFNSSPEGSNFQYGHVTSINNNWGAAPGAVSAQYNGNLAYQYFINKHARVSINGQGGNIISFINVTDKQGNSMDNAFWNGFAMFYGNGSQAFKPLARGLDVAGHEMTHGVVQNTANLEYYGESGALNESFADVFGAMIDRDDWLVGEDVVNTSAFPSGALRSLIDPNQGQPTNSFGTGWQPKHVNQQFTGQEDNNGVHINSGIPNHAFYQFANAVGKDKAEDVYYRALDKYLTKSSQFIDARLAVIQSAEDLGLSSNEIQAARNAFDIVGITDGTSTTTPTDIDTNPGEDYVIYSSEDETNLNLIQGDGTIENIPLIENVGVLSKPSVSDNGSKIFFINGNNQIHEITIDWSGNEFSHNVFADQNNSNWDFIAVSKQGDRLAGVRTIAENLIWIYDFEEGEWFDFELFNPTFSQNGEKTFDVLYADVLEFDYSGEFIMYDALNQTNGLFGDLTYFDIGFINVWNAANNSKGTGNINKLFSALPDDIQVFNPTFSKNSDFIMAFDYAKETNDPFTGTSTFELEVWGANLEQGEAQTMFSNNTLGYPSFSSKDDKIIYTKSFEDNNPDTELFDIKFINLDESKLGAVGSEQNLVDFGKLATWFSNGERALVDVIETFERISVEMSISPNPADSESILTFSGDFQGSAEYSITDLTGKLISSHNTYISKGEKNITLPVRQLAPGIYNVTLIIGDRSATTRLVKQ